jgi:predicted RNA-binding Zn-ribbon protein involved in translation (DUF1610 family)
MPASPQGAEAMTTIKATCPECGEVTLTPEKFELRVFAEVDEQDYYAFDCPVCGDRVAKSADARVVRLLRTGGVEPVESACHPEHPPAGLSPITRDELLEFHELLQRDDWLDAVVDAIQSP